LLIVASLAYGAAASINVNGGVVQAGEGSVGQCDSDGVSVGYHVKYDNIVNDFVVDFVTVSNIASACGGKTVAVQLTSGGLAITNASGTATIPAGGGSVMTTVHPPARAGGVGAAQVARD